jgi:FixJ family two-component response regulator
MSFDQLLAAGERSAPACLIVDVRMPGMSGLELQRRLAAEGRGIPVVFISGHPDEPARRAAPAAGTVEFLRKPFDDKVLLDAIARALAQAAPSSLSCGESLRNPEPERRGGPAACLRNVATCGAARALAHPRPPL